MGDWIDDSVDDGEAPDVFVYQLLSWVSFTHAVSACLHAFLSVYLSVVYVWVFDYLFI